MAGLTVRQLAQLWGCSTQNVNEKIKKGHLVKNENGIIEYDAIENYKNNPPKRGRPPKKGERKYEKRL